MNRREFESAISTAQSEEDRLAFFGALLSRESGLGNRLILVGESAIEIYLTAEIYTSQDIDIVGSKEAVAPALSKWGFLEETGRSRRVYWVKNGLGQVDVVGRSDRSGLPPRPWPTPFGDVMLGAVEFLVVRRLMRSARERSPELFRQAELLAIRYQKNFDWDYVRAMAKSEKVLPLVQQVQERTLRERSSR
jgi:hypothetical protein